MSIVLASLLSVLNLGDVEAYMLDVFHEEEFHYTGGRYKDQLFKYRLFRPVRRDDDELLPLLLWLHGTGDKGDDNIGQLKWLDRIIIEPERLEAYPYYILAVQCPTKNPGWFGIARAPDEMLNVAIAALDRVTSNNRVDPDRIYVAGVSAGGTASWEIAMRHPDRFAAVVPMSAGPVDQSRLTKIVDVPIWAFHSRGDPTFPLRQAEQTATSLKSLGGNSYLTVLDSTGHDSWSKAIRDYAIMDWMLSQRRGQRGGLLTRPGMRPWRVYFNSAITGVENATIVVPAGLACLVLWTGWRAFRLRQRKVNRTATGGTA